MNKKITITDFNELLQYQKSTKGTHKDIFILNDVIDELVSTPHTANFYGISYCLSGSCIVKNDLETYTFAKGQLFLLRPGEVHQVKAAEGFKVIHIMFHQNFVLRNFILDQQSITSVPLFRTDFPNLINLKKIEQKQVYKYINKINLQNKKEGIYSNHILESILTAFIYEICNIISINAENKEKKVAGGKEIFERFTLLLAEKHMVSKSVKFYANILNISPTYLNEIIKRKTTKSALTVINEYLIFKLKVFLTHTDYTVAEIAEIFNFSDATTFIRFFKKQTFLSPLKFRNNNFIH